MLNKGNSGSEIIGILGDLSLEIMIFKRFSVNKKKIKMYTSTEKALRFVPTQKILKSD